MTQYAVFDHTSTATPTLVTAWYDDSEAGWPFVPAAADMLTVTSDQWAARLADPGGWAITGGALVPHVVLPTILTTLQFMSLLTPAEQAGFGDAARASTPMLLWLIRLAGADFIDLADPLTHAGITAAVGAGLLTAARETQILAGIAPTA